MINFDKDGIYTYKGVNEPYKYRTTITSRQKMQFIQFVADNVVTDKAYFPIMRDLFFDFAIVNLFTDIDMEDTLSQVDIFEEFKPRSTVYRVGYYVKDTDKFYDVTKKVKNMTNNVIVIWLDYQDGDRYVDEISNCGEGNSRCLSAARVEQAFASDVIIQGNFTKDEAKKLTDLINSRALPTVVF